jgi:outer membrane protein assembly factor BamB
MRDAPTLSSPLRCVGYVTEWGSLAMGNGVTRRRFLAAVGAGATWIALTSALGCKLTQSAWAFRSRPDLSPPAVDVSMQPHDTAAGYIFITPGQGGAGQGGSLILNDSGQVVWFRPVQGTQGRAMNLKVQTYRGRPVLTWGEVPSDYVIFDDSYREIKRFRAGNGRDGDHHEFLISPQDTALITIYNPTPWDLSSVGGLKDGVAWQGIVQELDIDTGEVLFEWRSLEHVGLDETYVTPSEDHYRGIDYFHINSVDVDHDDNLLVSARETSAIYKIDRMTGEVIWRLGGKKSDFEMGPGARFAFQHDARRQSDGTVSIFDNGTTVFHNGIPKAIEESRGIVLELDEEGMTATLVREYTHPDKLFADAAGNMQVLPNGNVFIGWGRALAFSEFSKDGELLFDARLPPENKSYRAFRFPWNADPSDQPAAVAERASEDEIRVYASWNGATQVATWEVLAGSRPNQPESLGWVLRDGFETAMSVRTAEPYVVVRAKNRSDRVLGTAEPVKQARRSRS